MRRDMGVIRELLLFMEQAPPGPPFCASAISIDGQTRETIREHLVLIDGGGFLRQPVIYARDGDVFVLGLTWEGHDFLNSIRSDTVWNKVVEKLKSTGISATTEIVKALAIQIGKQIVGL